MAIKINVNQEVTQRLKFEPLKNYNMLCFGTLESVEYTEPEIDMDSNWEFKGLKVPRLAFHFSNFKMTTDELDRFFTHSELTIAAVKKDGQASTDDALTTRLTALWGRLKHIHDAYKSSPNYRPITFEPVFSTASEADAVKRNEEFKVFFSNFYNAFVGDASKGEKPIWIGADGKSIPMVMKLIATDGQKSQYLDFPAFVGEGFIQPLHMVNNQLSTTLKFRPNETVVLKAIEGATPAGPAGAPVDMSAVPDEVRQGLMNR